MLTAYVTGTHFLILDYSDFVSCQKSPPGKLLARARPTFGLSFEARVVDQRGYPKALPGVLGNVRVDENTTRVTSKTGTEPMSAVARASQ